MARAVQGMACSMTARRADLTGVVLLTATFPEQHFCRVVGTGRVNCTHKMPMPAMRAVQLVTGMERRIVAGEIAARIMRSSRIV